MILAFPPLAYRVTLQMLPTDGSGTVTSSPLAAPELRKFQEAANEEKENERKKKRSQKSPRFVRRVKHKPHIPAHLAAGESSPSEEAAWDC